MCRWVSRLQDNSLLLAADWCIWRPEPTGTHYNAAILHDWWNDPKVSTKGTFYFSEKVECPLFVRLLCPFFRPKKLLPRRGEILLCCSSWVNRQGVLPVTKPPDQPPYTKGWLRWLRT